MKAAGHQVIQRRSARHIVKAERTKATWVTTFQVTTGPNTAVIGENTTPTRKHRRVNDHVETDWVDPANTEEWIVQMGKGILCPLDEPNLIDLVWE